MSKSTFYPKEEDSKIRTYFSAPQVQITSTKQLGEQNKNFKEMTLFFNPEKWAYLPNFNEFNDYFDYFDHCLSFPLCPTCCFNCVNQIKMLQVVTVKAITSFHFLPNEISVAEIESAIKEISESTKKEEADPLTSSQNFNSPRLSHENLNFQKNSITNVKIDDPNLFYSKIIDFPIEKESHFSITSLSVFRIGFDRHYITINGARIGFYQYQKNTIEENNIGLHFLVHLIWSITSSFGITFKDFEILPTGHFKTEQNNLIPLEIPKTNAEIVLFNKAMDFLFLAAASIFASPNVVEYCCAPPFEIHLNKKIIEQTSYTYANNAHLPWSRSIRYLCFNLKILQTRTCSMFVSV